jgi:two-component system chemotaxis sensor kinase CheA
LVRLEAEQARKGIEMLYGTPIYRLRGQLLPLAYLNREFKLDLPAGDSAKLSATDAIVNIVVLQADGRQFGMVVDEINDTEEIVVKPLGRELKRVATFAGATILGDGRVALILDVAGVARRAGVLTEDRDSEALINEATSSDDKGDAGDALLLVQRGSNDRVALPLSLVARLEEVPCAQIERVASRRVMQYRGDILPLMSLDGILGVDETAGDVAAATDRVQVVVLSDGASSVGLEIDQILDIVYDRVVIKKAGIRPGVSGTAVIQGRVTQMLDVAVAMKSLGMATAS